MIGVVMSALEDELMIVDQSSCHIYGEVGYHAFEGFAEEEDEVPRLLRDLGDRHTLIMHNHGLLAVGRSVAEAFQFMRRLIEACEIHVRLVSTGAPIRAIPHEILEHTRVQIAQKRNRPAIPRMNGIITCAVLIGSRGFRSVSRPQLDQGLRVAQRRPLLREQVLITLRNAIVQGWYAPGARLTERELCEALGVSRTSVREVLRQLEAERLVHIEPKVGPIVAVLTPDDARQIYETREIVEGAIIRLFVARASADQVQRLRQEVDNFSAAAIEHDFRHCWRRWRRSTARSSRGPATPF
jgi:DNA-binding transcriptional regulator YhcF (GntR family)